MDHSKEIIKNFRHVAVAESGSQVYKDECIYSFDTPESPDGVYVNMKTFEAVGADFLDFHYKRYKHSVYLHHKRLKFKVNKPESSETKPKRLAIGVEGGFDPDAANKDIRYEDTYSILFKPDNIIMPIANINQLPCLYLASVESILKSESTDKKDNSVSVWDGEKRKPSKFADDLQQLEGIPDIPKSNWKCQLCDKTDNLWLNLTDGSILCGRKFFDGSGGNNHAVDHYQRTKYPLSVKLGTITGEGADIYSYPEDDMVLDPHLEKHLAHFGIEMKKMEKTEKSIIELEINMNEKLGEWLVIQEEGTDLKPASGPGFTGIANLGNSCYMNSVLQVLFSINEFQTRYEPTHSNFSTCTSLSDFNHQMTKLAYGLLSGNYSVINNDTKSQKGIKLTSFKHIVCGSNQNFSSKRQQDAHEFFLYLIDSIERANNDSAGHQNVTSSRDPSKCFEFVIEDRIQCSESKRVKYLHRVESCLSLHVDTDLAINKEEYLEYQAKGSENSGPSNVIRPKVPLLSCIQLFSKSEKLSDFYSTAIAARTTADKTSKITRFPQYMMMQMKKFQVGPDFTPKKLDVAFDVPDILDLEFLVGHGLQPGEQELEDADEPPRPSTFEPDSEAVATLMSMGIEPAQASTALEICNNDAQRAIEYIFDPESFVARPSDQTPTGSDGRSSMNVVSRSDPMKMKFFTPDNKAKLYHLKAFISHMGASTMCGHYVCHIKKDEKWYIFNDEKVAVSEKPPLEFGYLYLYERIGDD